MSDLCEIMTLKQIAETVGLASGGHAHDLKSGKQKSVSYDVGLKLVLLRTQKTQAIADKRAAEPKEQT